MNGRLNHDFQIVHYLAGGCHTPDGAYALLRSLETERQVALQADPNNAAIAAELATIARCIAALQPRRLHADLPDAEAFEAAQEEEERLRLAQRAKDLLLLTGTIPPDEFRLMRLHPAFAADIAPLLAQANIALRQPAEHAVLVAEAAVPVAKAWVGEAGAAVEQAAEARAAAATSLVGEPGA